LSVCIPILVVLVVLGILCVPVILVVLVIPVILCVPILVIVLLTEGTHRLKNKETKEG